MSTLFVFSSVSFADPNIAPDTNSADCKNSTLETYSGTSNLNADWEANTINLHWYNNNTLMENVPSVSSSCEYDSTLTPPATIPTRTGYTFTGWRVRPTYDFSTLTTSQDGQTYYAVDNLNGEKLCINYNSGNSGTGDTAICDGEFRELNIYEWKVNFSWGTIYGSVYCSAKSGNTNAYAWNNASSNWRATYNELQSANGVKQYCWCQATGYKPSGSNTLYGPKVNSLTWIFRRDDTSEDSCNQNCASQCAYHVTSRSGLRKALFGVTQ